MIRSTGEICCDRVRIGGGARPALLQALPLGEPGGERVGKHLIAPPPARSEKVVSATACRGVNSESKVLNPYIGEENQRGLSAILPLGIPEGGETAAATS